MQRKQVRLNTYTCMHVHMYAYQRAREREREQERESETSSILSDELPVCYGTVMHKFTSLL